MATNKDVPIDVVPDEEFNAKWGTKEDGSWRGYAAGTPTEQRRSNEQAALLDALQIAEGTRQFNEELAEKKREADMDYQLRMAAARSGGGGGLTAYQQYQIMDEMKDDAEKQRQWILTEARTRADKDNRLAGGKVTAPDPNDPLGTTQTTTTIADGQNYFSSAQLYDAHLRDLINTYGLDIADFGLRPLDAPVAPGQSYGNFRQLEENSKNQAKNW